MKTAAIKYCIIFFSVFSSGLYYSEIPVTDCSYTFEEAMLGISLSPGLRNSLALADVEYYSYDNRVHKGQLIVNKELEKEIVSIFRELKRIKFQIYKAVPIVRYNWNDSISMQNNNTSCFNFRRIRGAYIMSRHSSGRAIDINPLQNPQIKRGKHSPENAVYCLDKPGTVSAESAAVKIFKKYGWRWGGQWRSSKDYQHFEK